MQNEASTKANPNGGAATTGLVEKSQPTEETLKDEFEKFAAPAPRKGGEPDAKLLEATQKLQDEFLKNLTRQSRLKRWWLKVWRRSDPELFQVYGVIYGHLGEAQRLLAERAADSPGVFDHVAERLRALLEKGRENAHATNVHAAWALAGSLEDIILMLGDDNYVITRLESEREREQKKLPGSWSEYLAVETLDDMLEKYKPGDATGQRARAVESLAFLSERRHAYMRVLRASQEMKADYLNRLTYVLALLLLLLFETIYIASKGASVSFGFRLDLADPQIQNALVAAMTGAVGCTLSGFYKLRDEAGGIVALRTFRSAMRAQPFVGATVGVLLMLLIMSGVLAVGTTGVTQELKWLSLAVYCFLAGFSEPFFFGVVQRVAGAADKKAQGAAEGGAAGAAGNKAGEDKK